MIFHYERAKTKWFFKRLNDAIY
ncbi:protein of unknown function [Xenorhabdus poinarii G6]|uniref:Uncharacterized protein n=1 Tax=Xenorhabdus poinarii G6 TaxID=1354304 RepID=A0A068R3L9_9GAMM|nr:protein of unknown function [Xenorhabdus poinarii G6]